MRNLRSVYSQYRNVSSSRSSRVSKGSKFLIQGTGVTLGWISGNYMYGDMLDKSEEERQQIVRDSGLFDEVEDLREKMWPELRSMTWFRNVEKMSSGLRKNVEEILWSGRREESLWSDLKQMMWSDRKS